MSFLPHNQYDNIGLDCEVDMTLLVWILFAVAYRLRVRKELTDGLALRCVASRRSAAGPITDAGQASAMKV